MEPPWLVFLVLSSHTTMRSFKKKMLRLDKSDGTDVCNSDGAFIFAGRVQERTWTGAS